MSKFGRLLLGIALLILTPESSEAQFTLSIGTSAYSKQAFTCRTYTNKQDIIIKTGRRTKTVSKSSAITTIKNTIASINLSINAAKKTLRERRTRFSSLMKSPTLVLPSVAKEVTNLRDVLIPKAEARLQKLLAQKTELTFIQTGIKNCGKTQVFSSGNQIYTAAGNGPVTGTQWYFIAARHVFTFSGNIPREICVDINGKRNLTTWSQNACCSPADGSTTFNICANLGLLSNQGVIGLGSACDRFSRGYFDDHMAQVSSGLSSVVKVYLPTAGRCF